jgi:hypothetical protein
MDIDENDLLATNTFIKEPELTDNLPNEFNEEFRNYYKQEIENAEREKIKSNIEGISLKNFVLSEENDPDNLQNTNLFNTQGANIGVDTDDKPKRVQREIKTYISIDSRDRDKELYPSANSFKIFLNKTFYNVKSIRLSSVEFPNATLAVNESNNKIYWRNKNDIDNHTLDPLTNDYPVYKIELTPGNYGSINNLRSELKLQFSKVIRLDEFNNNTIGSINYAPIDMVGSTTGSSNYHNYEIDFETDTNKVTFTSLTITQINSINPIERIGPYTLKVTTQQPHGLNTGDLIYMYGVSGVAFNLPNSFVNGEFKITKIDQISFSYVVEGYVAADPSNIVPNGINGELIQNYAGGGNYCQYAIQQPFQFLFGEYNDTVASVLGFPLQNSAEQIRTKIKKIDNVFPFKVTLGSENNKIKHNFTNSDIGMYIKIDTSPFKNGRQLIQIIDDYSFILEWEDASGKNQWFSVEYDSQEFNLIYTKNSVEFNQKLMMSIYPFDAGYVYINTVNPHNYNISDKIELYETYAEPDLNNRLFEIKTVYNTTSASYSNTVGYNKLVIREPLFKGDRYRDNTIYPHKGHISIKDPIKTWNVRGKIKNIADEYIIIKTNDLHFLNPYDNPYDKIKIPSLDFISENKDGIFSYDILTTTEDLITINISNLTDKIKTILNNLKDKETQFDIFTSYIELYLPSHGFTERTDTTTARPYNFFLNNVAIPILNPLHNIIFNNKSFNIVDILDENRLLFNTSIITDSYEQSGGNNVFISSLKHGFNGTQSNTFNEKITRLITLQGENYVFLCSPQLGTMLNTGDVRDIFARIVITESPGKMIFSFLTNPKEFIESPLPQLSFLEFSVANYDKSLYNFNDLDYSFVLEIIEVQDSFENINYSSRRGVSVVNTTSQYTPNQVNDNNKETVV